MRLAALGMLLLFTGSPLADQPPLGDWAHPISAALHERPGGRGEELVLDRVERVEVTMPDDSQLLLVWSGNARLFVEALRQIESQAPTTGEGYNFSSGVNRFTQEYAQGVVAVGEHWADTTGSYRLALFFCTSEESGLRWLESFDAYRRAGGFGGWPSSTPPLTAQ